MPALGSASTACIAAPFRASLVVAAPTRVKDDPGFADGARGLMAAGSPPPPVDHAAGGLPGQARKAGSVTTRVG
ncbi:hypothetical protein [Accumulibacter sp.]|uniref:hypothetical protein n=1 Tax=Candidatus Accumulibacter TaxID=327159 RepID=UPI0002E424DE|nr:hypothetical protein [Accumulibacter sp.]MBN8499270.1 hypothetical protein [Accumulibacter sp.]